MPQSFFEGATITIKDPEGAATGEKITRKKFFGVRPYSGSATVEFQRGDDHTPFATKPVTIKNGKLTAPVTQKAADVNADEESYDLRVVCKYKGIEKQMLFCKIWPKKTKLLFLNQAGKPAKGFAFLVKQDGQTDQDLVSGGDGKAAVDLFTRGPYTVEPKGTFKVISDEQVTAGQYRDHKITVETVITAKFLSPDITQPEYVDDPGAAPAKKQWINLKSKEAEHTTDSGCDAKGHSVVFAVTANPPDKGQPGDRVYFEINLGRESKRNDPKPRLRSGKSVVNSKVSDKKTTGYLELKDVGGTATGYFEVELGEAGGDTCEVKIGGTPSVGDAKLKLINWRKLYAQVTTTATGTKPSLAPAKGCFNKVQIDLDECTADEALVTASSVPGSIVPGAEIQKGAPAQSFVVGDHNVGPLKTELKGKFKSDSLPVAHLIYCDLQYDAKGKSHTGSSTVLGKKDGQAQGMVTFPGGASVPGAKIDLTKIHAKAKFLSLDITDGSDSVKSCTWQEAGGTGSGVIPKTDYKIDQVKEGNYLFVRLPDAAKTLSDNGKDIVVKFTVAYSMGPYAGWCTSGDRHNVVKSVNQTDQQVCSTIVHEIGHAIFQAAQDTVLFPGLPAPPHDRFYTDDRGHFGPHCATGIDEATYKNKALKLDTAAAKKVCTCVMWGGTSPVVDAALSFCDKCEPYVKAAVIKSVSV